MDSPKRGRRRSKSLLISDDEKAEKMDVTQELNGETEKKESEPVENEATVNSPAIDKNADVEMSEIEAENDIKENNENNVETNQDENDKTVEINDENLPEEKKSRKRKLSKSLSETNDEKLSETEKVEELIEAEKPESNEANKTSIVENFEVSSANENSILGKGKRARIPNKRYSDISMSPSNKRFENGIERMEELRKDIETIQAPSVIALKSRINTGSPEHKRVKTSNVDVNNPNFRKPFEIGWRRELVWRGTNDPSSNKRNGDVYYYSPQGKKLRSMREVADYLTDGLTLDDFTFVKEVIGAPPEYETIRDAKTKNDAIVRVATPKVKKLSSPASKNASPKPQSIITKPVIRKPIAFQKKSDNESGMEEQERTEGEEKESAEDQKVKGSKSPSYTLRVKLPSKSKERKFGSKISSENENVGEELSVMSKKGTPKKNSKNARPTTADSAGSKLKRKPIRNSLSTSDKEYRFMDNYLQNLSYGYNTLLYVFQYLKVQDLLRAGCVCTMWRDISSHPLLWKTVRMKNSQVHSFEGLANTLKKHGTVFLDLRKMLLTNCDEIWPEFSSNIGKVKTLRKIELCRCPSTVVEKLMESNPKLEVLNAVTIKCESINLSGLSNLAGLKELRIKSTTGLTLNSDLESLRLLTELKHLSLTSVRDLSKLDLNVLKELVNLQSLELGECSNMPETFGSDILSKLTKLERLRLEKGQGECYTFQILEAVKNMPTLEQLELVNFDIKSGFDEALGACENIKKLLIIPTYISQSATTNFMVLGGVLRLHKSLSHFVWGVTLELLRVTELFVDQCENPEKKSEKPGDSIPVLKPVPVITDGKPEIEPAWDPPQVEILALPNLQMLLLQSLPTTRVKILKIPFHATWRQSITDVVN